MIYESSVILILFHFQQLELGKLLISNYTTSSTYVFSSEVECITVILLAAVLHHANHVMNDMMIISELMKTSMKVKAWIYLKFGRL